MEQGGLEAFIEDLVAPTSKALRARLASLYPWGLESETLNAYGVSFTATADLSDKKTTVLKYFNDFTQDYATQITTAIDIYYDLKPTYQWQKLIPEEFYTSCEGVDYFDVGFENCADEGYFEANFDWSSVGDGEIDK